MFHFHHHGLLFCAFELERTPKRKEGMCLCERGTGQDRGPATQSCPSINWWTITLYLPASLNLAPFDWLNVLTRRPECFTLWWSPFNFFLSVQHHFSPISSFLFLLSNLMFFWLPVFPLFSFCLWIRQPIRHDIRPEGIMGIRVYWGSQSERKRANRIVRQAALLKREYLCLIGHALTVLCICVCLCVWRHNL